MAAYHWEARRKQIRMQRRFQLQQERRAPPAAGQQQDVLREGKAMASPLPPTGLPQRPALQEATGCSCTCNTAHAQQNSGKLLKRYTTTEYFQQW